VADKISKIA
jgi:chaperonin GroEL